MESNAPDDTLRMRRMICSLRMLDSTFSHDTAELILGFLHYLSLFLREQKKNAKYMRNNNTVT